MNIGYLNELKEKLSITNDQLAQISGVPESTIARILNGTTDNPNFQTIVDIVRTLKGSVDIMEDLYREEKPVQKEEETNVSEKEIVAAYQATIATKDKWIRFLAGLLICIVSFCLIMIAYDLLHPGKGWIQY